MGKEPWIRAKAAPTIDFDSTGKKLQRRGVEPKPRSSERILPELLQSGTQQHVPVGLKSGGSIEEPRSSAPEKGRRAPSRLRIKESFQHRAMPGGRSELHPVEAQLLEDRVEG